MVDASQKLFRQPFGTDAAADSTSTNSAYANTTCSNAWRVMWDLGRNLPWVWRLQAMREQPCAVAVRFGASTNSASADAVSTNSTSPNSTSPNSPSADADADADAD
jgi:hypothetical protein